MDSLFQLGFGVALVASATSMTGGVSAGSGETVVTGSSYSSVQITNVINAGSGGGESTTIIETNIDGKKNSETIQKTIPPGEAVVEVIVATSSSNGSSVSSETRTKVEVRAHSSIAASSSLGQASSTIASAPAPQKKLTIRIFERISTFLSGFFGFFSFR